MIVRVEGEDFSQGRLRKYLPIFEEGVIDEDLLAEGRRNLTDYLQTRGYFSAQVDYARERERDDEVIIVYRIERGPRHQLVEIEIAGNNFFDTETIRERMLIHVKTFQMRRGRFSASLLRRDIEAIEELYRSNGFGNVAVDSRAEDDYRGKPGDIAVFIGINEGRPTLVSELAVKGIESIPREPLLAKLASVEGQPYSLVSVATDRDLILAEYFDAGYQDARFTWVPIPTQDPNQVRIEYQIEEGQATIVRRPIVSGLNHTKEWIVFPAIEVTPGQPLSQGDLFDSQRRLYDLGIFSKVEVGLQNPDGEEQNKTVLVQLEEARRWTLGFGAGAEIAQIGGDADPDTPLGKAAFSPRGTIEVTRLNVRGIAHTMSIRTRFSRLQQRALFTYEAPRWLGSDRWHMTISSLFDSARNVRTFQGSRLEGAFQLRQRPSRDLTMLCRYT
jgi:outer membrane protein assembly factor BamA